ncbi:hypothetical protein BS47DRAFT_1293488 [Hydnum rufescens UP504]|uniref:Inhibitor of apoptosis repeat-containing protein n=1 Tax=Hydnum rufescens UP504 TaxID=1448309 RepID=A0A9P6DUT2_9AGAM|nr:hypothetical protein BS47DRAFT_1293488 [Hydnum rufescens UP504]
MAPNYRYYTHRLASFDSQTISVVPTKGSRAAKSITFTWPHPPTFGATPRTLAAAGFYFAPEQGSGDRVVCFFCDVGLANWEKTDSPFEEHYTRNEDGCPWAAARCSLEKDRVKRGKTFIWKFSSPSRIPTDPARYNVRLRTFKGWPYDKAKGHNCTSKALARAGFVFAPDDDGYEDMAKCFYCDRELSGWSPDDDPL